MYFLFVVSVGKPFLSGSRILKVQEQVFKLSRNFSISSIKSKKVMNIKSERYRNTRSDDKMMFMC